MEKKELVKDAGFLQAVICLIAEEKFSEDCDAMDGAPGLKKEWLNLQITDWFKKTAKIMDKSKDEGADVNIKKQAIDISRFMYKSSLGENIEIDDLFRITRVPGGWVFTYTEDCAEAIPVFIPYDNEFQGLSKLDSNELLIQS